MKRRGALSLTFLILLLSLSSCASTRKPDRLVLWHTLEAPVARMALERKIHDYNRQHPEVEVVPILAGKSDASLTAIQRAGTTKDRPDLIWAYPALAAQLADSGVAVPLDDYLKDFDQSSVYPVLWQQTTYRGKIWGLPFDHDNLAIFYNKNHFREADLSIPRTWSEFRAVARSLTKEGRHGFLVPFGKEEWAVWTWETLLWQAGGDLLDSHAQPVFDSPAGVRALAFWRGLLADGSAVPSLPEKGAKPDDFIQGKVSMFMSGPWTLSELPRNFPYGVFPLPRGDRAAGGRPRRGSCAAVRRGSKGRS
ncbi:MAG: extracellular solute-binding protein [Bacteroidota bacterium]